MSDFCHDLMDVKPELDLDQDEADLLYLALFLATIIVQPLPQVQN